MNKKFKKIIIFLAIIYVGYIFVNQQLTMKRIEALTKEKQKEIEVLKNKNQRLQDELKMSKTDMYIEKLAREKLGLIKPGETPVIDTSKSGK